MKNCWSVKICLLVILLGGLAMPASAKDTYPKLANYYLRFFNRGNYEELSKWDFLIIQQEMAAYNPDFFDFYRQKNPDGLIVPYTYPAMFFEEASQSNYNGLPIRRYVLDEINNANWWLRNASGNKVYSWPRVAVVNVTSPAWQNFTVETLRNRLGIDRWDGVMYDMVDAEIQHYSANGIDINGDGQTDSPATVNQKWREGMAQLFAKTRQMIGRDKIIITNGNSLDVYQPNTNGRIFENFPTPWEGNGSWQASMYQYLRRLPSLNYRPAVYVINATTNNTGNMANYRHLRFGLTSALLGDGYFSFDFGDKSHEQLWWYDEYDVELGHAVSSHYNLLDINNDYVRAGLWRRDFENGISIVNSTNKDQIYVFRREQFEKLRGTQDRRVNDGTTVNYIKLAPNDGIIMRTVKHDVIGPSFVNGNLVRVFDLDGKQIRNSFFAYKADVDPNLNVVLADLDGNGSIDRVAERGGQLIVSGPGRRTFSIAPYGANFKGRLSFGVYDLNKDNLKEIIVAPLSGGGPHVKTYGQNGKLLSPGFFAFDPNFRGGVSIAVGDANNDGKGEIVVAPASGLAPTVKFFSDSGQPLGSFLAFDKNFRGGVNLAIGDVDNDGKNEVVTGPLAGGPHIRVFTSGGLLRAQFMAFDPKGSTGVRVMVGDTDGDGKNEILAGTANF